MKRRLKNEIYNRKKFQQMERSSEEAKEFEESLLRLAQLAKNRVKISDFTNRDKSHLLDLFVNNEKTLLKIYEALFPHRVTAQPQPHSQQMSYIAEPQMSYQAFGRPDAKSAGSGRVQYSNNSFVQGNVHVSYNGPVLAVHPQQLQSLTMQNQRFLNQLTQEGIPMMQPQSSLPSITTGLA